MKMRFGRRIINTDTRNDGSFEKLLEKLITEAEKGILARMECVPKHLYTRTHHQLGQKQILRLDLAVWVCSHTSLALERPHGLDGNIRWHFRSSTNQSGVLSPGVSQQQHSGWGGSTPGGSAHSTITCEHGGLMRGYKMHSFAVGGCSRGSGDTA